MPQQLIYTSAPRGVVAGRSGHCTVARSATLREALMLQLEKWSYYQHLSLSGGRERPIFCCRVMDLRGARYHVLTRIQDAGLDFTGRTNFLAHHLVFTPEEIRQFPAPPTILLYWPGWVQSWTKEPELLEREDWTSLAALPAAALPAKNWQALTGDAVHGYGLLEARAGRAFRVDRLPEAQILALFSESLELLELRDPRRDFRASGWQYTFTTSLQEQDNPADFRWRCLHADNPAASRFAGPDCRELADICAARVTDEETRLAQTGRQVPQWITQPQNARVTEGEAANFRAQAEGVPAPRYQWFALDRAGNGQPLSNGNEPELALPQPPLGVSRYVVRASNSQGEVTSEVVTLSVEAKLRLAPTRPPGEGMASRRAAPAYIKSEEQIDRQRQRIAEEKAAQQLRRSKRLKKILAGGGLLLLLAIGIVTLLIVRKEPSNKSSEISMSSPASGAGSDEGSTGVTKVAIPTLQIEPTNGELRLRTNFEFRVDIQLTTNSTLQWYRDDGIISGATNSILWVTNSASEDNAHKFYAVVSNEAESVTSIIANLNYIGPHPPLLDGSAEDKKP